MRTNQYYIVITDNYVFVMTPLFSHQADTDLESDCVVIGLRCGIMPGGSLGNGLGFGEIRTGC